MLPGKLERESFIQDSYFANFNLKYRSASMSVLNCLAKHSNMLAITDTLSTSVCHDDMVFIQPRWLNAILPNRINHALYYLEKNHHVPLYSFSCEVVKKVIEDKLSEVRKHTTITD